MRPLPPILVGIDPVHHDADAPVFAALLARATGAPVVAVATHPDRPPRSLSDDDHQHALRGDALARLLAVEPAFHGLALETAAVPGPSAARVLHDCAQEREAALLVLGSTHQGVIGRITLGSTADRLLHGATFPVAIAPAGFADRMRGIDRIGAAFIDSEEGQEALRAAAALASACGAELHAATAVEPLPWSTTRLAHPIDVGAHLEHQREQAANKLERAVDCVRPDVRSHTDVLVDPPVVALEEFSSGVDLLVCGSRGYGPLGSVLLGGVSRRLVHRAACPVLVVPRGTERALENLAGGYVALEHGHA
jgi:nucleotide-binding universal stress UspA family protein